MGRQGNAFRKDGFANTFIMEKEKILVNGTEDGLPKAVRATYDKTKTSAALCGYNSKPTLVMEQTEPKILSYTRQMVNGKVEVVNRHTKDVANTIHASHFENTEQYVVEDPTKWRIRKLTPTECGRLMGCDDETIEKMKAAGIPKTQLYKLYGNSIVVDVLFHIFRKMFIDQSNESKQMELF